MKKLFSVCILVLVLQFTTFSQNGDFEKGLKLAQKGDFQNALSFFQKSYSNKLPARRQAQIYYNIGVCLFRLNQPSSAVVELTKAVSLNPVYFKAFYALGMAQQDLHNYIEAEKAFRTALNIADEGEIWFDLGINLFSQNKFSESLAAFQNAQKSGSSAVAESHNNSGVIYALQGDFTAAEKEIKIARNLGFRPAENNLLILQNILFTKDNNLIGKLLLTEKNHER